MTSTVRAAVRDWILFDCIERAARNRTACARCLEEQGLYRARPHNSQRPVRHRVTMRPMCGHCAPDLPARSRREHVLSARRSWNRLRTALAVALSPVKLLSRRAERSHAGSAGQARPIARTQDRLGRGRIQASIRFRQRNHCRLCDFHGIISRFHDRRGCGGSIRLLTPAKETGIVLMRCVTARLSMVGADPFRWSPDRTPHSWTTSCGSS